MFFSNWETKKCFSVSAEAYHNLISLPKRVTMFKTSNVIQLYKDGTNIQDTHNKRHPKQNLTDYHK